MDNNATSQVDPEVFEAMKPFFTKYYGNASSMHTFGGQVKHYIDHARGQVADLLGCDPDEIIFTSGGTESDNTAIHGVLELSDNKRHIITTRVEHPAVRTTCRHMQKQGCRLTELSVDGSGQIDLDQLRQTIDDSTALVTVMYANNETGVIFPIEKIAQIVKGKGALMHTDAVQAVGKVPINLNKLPVDLLSLSGHKLHGPKGIGVLYVRKGTPLSPFMIGGHQERGLRAGTENVAGIVGIGKACELAQKYMAEENGKLSAMRDRLETGLLKQCDHTRVNGDRSSRLCNTTNISFEYIEGEGILLTLDRLGIAASSGSACTSGSLEPSHVLRAMGVPFTAVHGSIRFSLSRYTQNEDIDYVIKELPPLVAWLRSMSPFTPQSEAAPDFPQERKKTLI